MSTVPSSSARQALEELGTRLRDLRKDAGLSGRALAAATGQHFTRVSKIEHGVQTPSDQDIRAWCLACGATDQIPDLIAAARAVESAYRELRRQARAGMKRVLGPHTVTLYERTGLFRIYEHNVIPGLFQTADYAAAMLSFWIEFLDSPNDLGAAVATRMERQRVIYQRDKVFDVVLEEQALRTWFGTAETQAGQLDRLLAVMSLPGVRLGIIPMMTERKAVGSAGFWIFDNSLAALEIPTASIEVTRPQEIEMYARMFGYLESAAVHGPAARALISRTLAELDHRNLSQHCGRPASRFLTSQVWRTVHRPPPSPGRLPMTL
ncbi:MAG TPA: helix-turn-helix transcriptional regulator [Streptosporangiaceae bacterium]|nr:helix-turn-helix transcriptional regulator [Streptosporangiaceae bacterium]